ncbi:AmmeMemoRadiSam system radical SAM enzyme [uncultured Desulfobacter sp.]|uniref:AmmeMemoRadiSam system radical SAM enzyme n=1 Tax=uncultured Desulfobacter sp. TaxID=240139 RepID=UPI002AAB179C|nr:AmmeMemoRadiSam system radical SAM enzyme [uncultured Desulfobacter sp.]
MIRARLYETLSGGGVKCLACNHYCKIKPGQTGVCGVRENRNGQLFSLVYDRVVAASVDPIEKKPIFHFKPGSRSFSIAAPGCNFNCRFCQNADISQVRDQGADPFSGRLAGQAMTPEAIVAKAVELGCQSISYTYTEPTVFFELVLDTAMLAKDAGLANILVTNGFMSPKLLQASAAVLDVANVDLKSFSDAFYIKYCNGRLEPVKQTLKTMVDLGLLVEVTTLVIPGLNDDPGELEQMASFIAGELGSSTPWHLSRFHPAYQLTQIGSTPVETLETACDIALSTGLVHVYTGNVPGARENTCCPACGRTVVKRFGYTVENLLTQTNKCPGCAAPVFGIY